MELLFRIFRYQSPRSDIEVSKQAGAKTKEALDDLKTTINGEDHWFIKACDQREEADCPAPYLENNHDHV